MFERRVTQHFREAGWRVESRPALDGPDGPFHPDLLIEKNGRRKAVLVRADEPPGPFEIARFGAACKKLRIPGIVVAPDDPALFELYDQAGLEFVPGESIGDVVVVGHAPAPPPMPEPAPAPAQPVALPPVVLAPSTGARSRWWRWVVVALVWLAALAVLAYDVVLYTR